MKMRSEARSAPLAWCEGEGDEGSAWESEADWRSFQHVLCEAVECAIDRAMLSVLHHPEDLTALEHLRLFARERFAGRPAAMRVSDLLQALGILLGSLESEPREDACGPAGRSLSMTAERLRHIAKAAVAHRDSGPERCGPTEDTRKSPRGKGPASKARSSTLRRIKARRAQAA